MSIFPKSSGIYKTRPATTAPTPISPTIPAGSRFCAPDVGAVAEAAADEAPEAPEDMAREALLEAPAAVDRVPEALEDAMVEPEEVAAATASVEL